VEAAAEALHYADSEPLIRIEADKGGRKMWPQVPAAITMRDGSVVMTTRDCHPDPRCEAIRRAIAAELSQAVARCRPYYRTAENPCDLIIWTDTPIEGLPVDELTRWDAEPLSVAWQSGFVPFTPAAAHAAHPALWTSPAAIQSEEYRARGAARGYDWKPWTDKSGDDAVEAAAGQGMALIAYRLPSPSGLRAGKTTRAWVAAEHCGDLDTLAAFVRGFGGHAEASDFGVLSSATARTEAEHCDDLIEASEDEALAVSLGLIAPPVAEPSTAIPMPTAFWPSPIELIRRRRKAA